MKRYFEELFGERDVKYSALSSSTARDLASEVLNPTTPFYLFSYQDQTFREEFEDMPLFSEATLLHSVGVVSARDQLTITFAKDEIWQRVKRFVELEEEKARIEFNLRKDVRDWKVSLAQEDLNSRPLSKSLIKPILYRPFDLRFTYYTGKTKRIYRTACYGYYVSHDRQKKSWLNDDTESRNRDVQPYNLRKCYDRKSFCFTEGS